VRVPGAVHDVHCGSTQNGAVKIGLYLYQHQLLKPDCLGFLFLAFSVKWSRA